ncbi:IclR family transcriptional regulator [Nocardia bovistercoris]|uniref:IclR family transcriptional regulator n=1 Tax=Nocardia bovistercoris TaxID=2785916 RepID=A0A931I9H8_9NOCA|nr:IclR family transcriptional regulator [Nocardia bovistercoris]MBH0776340.1 IclR family transcriptional regulator [Nocardia bovistercoris]
MTNEVPAVSAAIRILEALAAASPRAVSPGALAGELGLNRSTCYNILATLQRSGWVNNLGPRSGCTLGPSLLSLATSIGSVETTVAVAQEEIDSLSRQLGYVVFAARQESSGEYSVVAVSDPGRGIRVTVDVGDRFPFSAPALMQAFYAHRPFADFLAMTRTRTIEQFTEQTVTDVAELDKVFAVVRDQGYSTSVQQFDLSQGAVASPVFDRTGRPSLALGTLAFASDLDATKVHEVGPLLRATANTVTARSGGLVSASTDAVHQAS